MEYLCYDDFGRHQSIDQIREVNDMTREEILTIAKPILFNTEMVRAILEGRKTTTRRILKLPKHIKKQENGLYTLFADGTCYENQHLEEIVDYIKQPYKLGDYLYVRETWANVNTLVCPCYYYRASEELPDWALGGWKPSIHMPKQAARIFLRVTDVRVERLNDITEEEAVKEGLYKGWHYLHTSSLAVTAKQAFMWLWDMTIKLKYRHKYGWIANPWVWVIEFERVED